MYNNDNDEEEFRDIDDTSEQQEDNSQSENTGNGKKDKGAVEKAQDLKENIELVTDVARVAAGDMTAAAKILINPKNWKKTLKIIAIVVGTLIISIMLIIAVILLIFQAITSIFVGAGNGIQAAWSYFWEGTDASVTQEIVRNTRETLISKGVDFNQIGYIGEEIFSEAGIRLDTSNTKGEYTVSKSAYKAEDPNNPGIKLNNKVDKNKAIELYISQYLSAQAYSTNRTNKWTVSGNTGAIKIQNNADGFFQPATGKDEQGIYVNIDGMQPMYINGIIDEFGMPWQFPFAFHQATLCPDLGWKVADLAKQYHSLELRVEKVVKQGERKVSVTDEDLDITYDNWESFKEESSIVLITKKSTWYSSEVIQYTNRPIVVDNESEKSTTDNWVVTSSVVDDSNREALKALIAKDVEYYRSNTLSKKDKLKFETSAKLVVDMLKRAYYPSTNGALATSKATVNEPILNLMKTLFEMGYLEDTALNDALTINLEDYIVYPSPLEGGLPTGWPREEEKFDGEYLKFKGQEGQKVLAVAEGKVLEIGSDYIAILEVDTNFVITYKNLVVDPVLTVGATIFKGQGIGKATDLPLLIKVIDDTQQVIDPTALFMIEGIEGSGGYIYYNQAAEPWGKLPYPAFSGDSSTYASSACGPTSLAIIIANVKHDPSITPMTTVNMILSKYPGYRVPNNGTAWAIFTDSKFLSEFDMPPGISLGANPTQAVLAAQNGQMVAIIQTHMTQSGGTSGHFLVFAPPPNGEVGLIQVLDPASRKVTGLRTYPEFVRLRQMVNYRSAWAFDIE